MRAMRPIRLILAAVAALLMLACQREPLELYYDGRADLKLTYDWLSQYGERPDGMTLMLAHNSDSISYYDVTHNIDQTSMRLKSGQYLLTAMNKTFGEYSTMSFFRRNSHNDIYAQANTYHINNETAWDNRRTYMEEPEKIGVAVDTFYVTTVIDSIIFYDYRKNINIDTIHYERNEVIHPMTTTLNIKVKVRGISYMRSMSGYIMGMADGFYLNQWWRRTDVGTIKLDHWLRTREDTIATTRDNGVTEENVGWMYISVETFGLPHGRELLKQRTPESNFIMLHFTLIDGRTINFSYNVGKHIHYVGDDGTMDTFEPSDVALELDLLIDAPIFENDELPNLPYSQPEGTGQFDAEVAPWGDDVEVEIPM